MRIPWQFPLIYILIISYLSHQPSENLSSVPSNYNNIDKILHFVEFSILGFLVLGAILEYNNSINNSIMISLLFCFLFACFDEYHQSFISGRHSSVYDLLSDTIGLVFGNLVYYKLFH